MARPTKNLTYNLKNVKKNGSPNWKADKEKYGGKTGTRRITARGS